MRIPFLYQLLIAAILLINFGSQPAAAQNSNNAEQTILNERIVGQINRDLSKLGKTVFDFSKPAAGAPPILYRDRGRVLKFVACFDKNQIRKIVADAEAADRTRTIGLYYDNEQLIFAFDRILFRDKATKAVVQKMRDEYKLKNGELISVYSGIVFFERDEQNPDFIRYRDSIAQLSKSLLEAINRDGGTVNK